MIRRAAHSEVARDLIPARPVAGNRADPAVQEIDGQVAPAARAVEAAAARVDRAAASRNSWCAAIPSMGATPCWRPCAREAVPCPIYGLQTG